MYLWQAAWDWVDTAQRTILFWDVLRSLRSQQRNHGGGPRISAADSRVSVWVIPTDEERMIAEHTLSVVSGTA
jgi:acetate kinase